MKFIRTRNILCMALLLMSVDVFSATSEGSAESMRPKSPADGLSEGPRQRRQIAWTGDQDGDLDETYNLGVLCLGSMGFKREKEKSIFWFRKAAGKGHILSQFELGNSYKKGRGVPKDEKQAVEWYRRAAEKGHAPAQFKLTKLAAEKGHPEAQYDLGWAYIIGKGVPKDKAKAVDWYRRAAEQGHADAQNRLGGFYANGIVVAADPAQAIEWHRKAAEAGHDVAQYDLGMAYETGTGVAADLAQAVFWYRRAAEAGYAPAQYTLGIFYANGKGLPKDELQAAIWYRKAAEQGHPEARTSIMTIPPAITTIAVGHEALYQQLMAGRLEYRPTPGNDAGLIILFIGDLLRPLAGTANPFSAAFDLSGCGDVGEHISINIGYKKTHMPANAHKTEVWICPKFLAEQELATTASSLAPIMAQWEGPVGYFWTRGKNEVAAGNYDYLLNGSGLDKDKNLYEKWMLADPRDPVPSDDSELLESFLIKY